MKGRLEGYGTKQKMALYRVQTVERVQMVWSVVSMFGSLRGYRQVSKVQHIADKQTKWYEGYPKSENQQKKSIQVAKDQRSGIAEPH